jgi:hypothetical protein
VFAQGRYDLARTIFEIQDWLELREQVYGQKSHP